MLSFFVTSLIAFVMYLLLTVGSGTLVGFWSGEELLVGAGLSLIVGFVTRQFLCNTACQSCRPAALSPLRWVRAIVYAAGPFFIEMAKANWDVATRVLTGKIRPGIVRIQSGMKTDLGTLMLANSITLTPGTLTVDIEEDTNDLFVHMLNVPEELAKREVMTAREVFSIFDCPAWIRRIAE